MPPARRRRDGDDEPDRPEGRGRARGGGDDGGNPPPRTLKPRREQYLIAHKPSELLPQGVEPLDLSVIEQGFRDDEEIEFKRSIRPLGVLAAFAANTPGAQEVLVAAMPPARAEQLDTLEQLIVEPDALLELGMPTVGSGAIVAPDPGTLAPAATEFNPTIVVEGSDGNAVAGASVYVFGRLFPYQGTTGADGKVTLTLFNETPDTVKSIYVKPKADYWSIQLFQPELRDDDDNVVTIPTLGSTLEGFPDQEVLGWGQKAMGLDEVPRDLRGRGVKVGVIDSGAGGSHRDLQEVTKGFDVAGQSEDTWNQDVIGHGSHCAGIILGRENDRGVRGFAPDAEFFVYKIFPGGRFSDLLDALDRCLSDNVDVVNLSLGTTERSEIVEQKLAVAKRMGMACIVAAGNDAGPVRFPALSPDVFAVAAIGKQGEYPANSYHATQVAKDTKVTQDGFFSAKFTCFGPEIDVAAPGVGIVSSVPEDTYAAWDGTSMASPHVCGLAALMLAHHPDFKARFKLRSEKRVERLFELIKDSCRALEFGDRNRSGAGLPHAIRALGLAGDGATQPAAAAPPQPGAEREPQAGAPQSVASNGNGRAPSWLDGLRSLLEGAGLLSSGVRVAPMAVDELLVPGLGAVHTASVAQLTVLVQAAGLAEEGASTVEPQTAGDPIAPLTELMTAAGLTTADG